MTSSNKHAPMRHLSLFAGSGIGSLAAKVAGITTVAHAENDPACCYCLERLWPDARLFRDVRDVTASTLADLAPIDIISGGFPCQDVSTAGKGEGLGTEEKPTRSGLWFEFARVIREVRPTWLLIENVPALRVRGGDRVTNDLEAMAYEWEAVVVGAWAVGAPHKRDRVWIVAHKRGQRCERRQGDASGRNGDRTPTGRQQGDDHAAGQDLAGKLDDTAGPRCDRTVSDTESDSWDEARLCGLAEGRGASDQSERGPEGRTATGRSGKARELVNAMPDGLRVGGRSESEGTLQRCDGPVSTRWPSRPGEPQHPWEAPRLTQFGLGDATDGIPRRVRSRANKAALRMVGNAWCYPVAEMMFRAIVELDRNGDGIEA